MWLHGERPGPTVPLGHDHGVSGARRALGRPPKFTPQAWSAHVQRWRQPARVSSRRSVPRRFPHLVGIVPGRRTRRFPPTIVFAIDTSGSLDAIQLAAANVELAALAHHVSAITVVHCDATVHRVEPYGGELREVYGGGGTDLRPPFELARQLGVDALVYFTDADGSFPDSPPEFPVTWLLSPGAKKRPPWGTVLRCG